MLSLFLAPRSETGRFCLRSVPREISSDPLYEKSSYLRQKIIYDSHIYILEDGWSWKLCVFTPRNTSTHENTKDIYYKVNCSTNVCVILNATLSILLSVFTVPEKYISKQKQEHFTVLRNRGKKLATFSLISYRITFYCPHTVLVCKLMGVVQGKVVIVVHVTSELTKMEVERRDTKGRWCRHAVGCVARQ